MKQRIQVFNFTIQNAADDAVDIYIDGDIVDADTQQMYKYWLGDDTSVSYKSFRDQVNASQANTFNIYINSPGGLVTDAMAIHDLLIAMQAKGKVVNTIGRGIIASAATYILMAGNTCCMSANSWLMIHNVSGIAYGNVNEVEAYAATMRKFNDSSTQFYADATGLSKTVIANMMNAETWLTAQEAKDKGFIKSIEGDMHFSQAIPKDQWVDLLQYHNMAVLNSYNAAVKPAPATNSLTQLFDDMKKFFTDSAAALMNKIKDVKIPENGTQQDLVNSIAQVVGDHYASVGEQIESEVALTVTQTLETQAKNPESELAKLIQTAAQAEVKSQITTPIDTLVTNSLTTATEGFVKQADYDKEMQQVKGSATSTAAPSATTTKKPVGGFREDK